MEIFIKNLGGKKALKSRIIFIILAVLITSFPLLVSKPETVKTAVETTTVVVEETTKAPEEETTEAELAIVSVSLESVEKDIRIGFYDETGHPCKGYGFKVIVVFSDGKEGAYEDADKDGYIVVTGVTPGLAKVTPEILENVIFNKESYQVTVKDHVEYKPIKNVVVKNDGADTKKAVKSPKLEDTVKLIDSRVDEVVKYVPISEMKLKASNPYPEIVENTTKATVPETTEPSEATSEENTTEVSTTEPTTAALTTKLLDSTNQHQLYVKDGNDYREATYADYDENTVFYIKEVEKTYYGWQNIDGKMYYYDENGKYVVGKQIIGGVQYTFSQTGVRGGTLGVDVSVYQGNINWAKAKAAGIDFAIIRLGYRGWGSNGSLNIDAKFQTNLAGAKAAGIKVGVYFFSQAKTEVEAVEEASLCIKELGGKSLDLPIFIDTETAAGGQGRADNLSVSERTAVCVAFCNTIRNAGYKAGVYSNKYFYTSRLNTSELLSYTIWLAEWPSNYTPESKPSYSGRYDIWQFSERGDGATYGMGSQYVDMNYS